MHKYVERSVLAYVQTPRLCRHCEINAPITEWGQTNSARKRYKGIFGVKSYALTFLSFFPYPSIYAKIVSSINAT